MLHSHLEEKERGLTDILMSEDDPQVAMLVKENISCHLVLLKDYYIESIMLFIIRSL